MKFPPTSESFDAGEVLPIPTLPAKYAVPVVVALPEMVRPSVPLPMVVEASERRPLVKVRMVEVALPENGYAAASDAGVV